MIISVADQRALLKTKLTSCSLDSDKNYQLVMDEAHSWLGTPWKPTGIVKGEAIDCIKFLAVCSAKYGLEVDIPRVYLQQPVVDEVLPYLHEIGTCLESSIYGQPFPENSILTEGNFIPGTVLLFRFRGISHHLGIVVTPWEVIHASLYRKKVIRERLSSRELDRITHCFDLGFRQRL